MNILTLDTATKLELIIAGSDNRTEEVISTVNLSHSITLFDNIDRCLHNCGITINNLDLIGVGIGPGSFTGIRIAVSTARMLAQATSTPIAGIKTHEIFAYSMPAETGNTILIAFDAKKKRVFGAAYKRIAPFGLEEIVPPGDYPMEILTGKIDPDNKTLACGDGIRLYYDTVKERIKDINYLEEFRPSSSTVIELFKKKFQHNPEAFSDYTKVVPFYARKSDAEIAHESRKKNTQEA